MRTTNVSPSRPDAVRRAPRPPDVARLSSVGVTLDESRGSAEYNYRSRAEFEAKGEDFFSSAQPFEMPGQSCFLQAGGRVFHTYSQYARGLECTGGSYYFLDLTALGRQEEWEEPTGRSESVRSNRPDFSS
ncbi:MAG TPA: DUF899 family protein [Streptosporangiaceae bacterium]|nr:DUF899 family protein [Streptosporangiaceae bacterium]